MTSERQTGVPRKGAALCSKHTFRETSVGESHAYVIGCGALE